MKTLQLSLIRHWFEMTKSGVKTEEYRKINDYWARRLILGLFTEHGYIKHLVLPLSKEDYHRVMFKQFTHNRMTLGYPKRTDTSRIVTFLHEGIEIREGREEWGAEKGEIYFVIKHGIPTDN